MRIYSGTIDVLECDRNDSISIFRQITTGPLLVVCVLVSGTTPSVQ